MNAYLPYRMACAFCYYGLVLMTTELFETSSINCSPEENVPGQTMDTCAADCRQLQTTDYMDLLWTTLAEFPGNNCSVFICILNISYTHYITGIFATIFVIERYGRKKTMAVQFVLYAICSCFLLICTRK